MRVGTVYKNAKLSNQNYANKNLSLGSRVFDSESFCDSIIELLRNKHFIGNFEKTKLPPYCPQIPAKFHY